MSDLYPKELHTFKTPPMTAWVYNSKDPDTSDPYANYIIEVIGEKYVLHLERDIYESPSLSALEAILFDWLHKEGVTPINQ
jgi:hypothetical protein